MKTFIEDLYQAYSTYCTRTGSGPVSYSEFCEELNQCPYLGIDFTPNRPLTFNRLPLSSWPPIPPPVPHTVDLFLNEACIITENPADTVSIVDLHRIYIQFCASWGLQPIDFVSFRDHIEAKPEILSGLDLRLRGNLAFAGIKLNQRIKII